MARVANRDVHEAHGASTATDRNVGLLSLRDDAGEAGMVRHLGVSMQYLSADTDSIDRRSEVAHLRVSPFP